MPKVYYLENDEDDFFFLNRAFEKAGFPNAVRWFTTGHSLKAALAADEEPPDIILLDQKLDGETGIEILAELRKDSRLADVPIFIFSSGRVSGEIIQALDANASGYIFKPSVGTAYSELVATLKRQYLSPSGSSNEQVIEPRPILIVEDEAVDAYIVQQKLQQRFENPCFVAENADRVRAVFNELQSKNQNIALAILDLKMPDVAPDQVASRLRKTFGPDVPICVLTNYPNDILARQTLAAGADYLLPKPFDDEEFVKWLARKPASELVVRTN